MGEIHITPEVDEDDRVQVVSLPHSKYEELREILKVLDDGNTEVLKKIIEKEKSLSVVTKWFFGIIVGIATVIGSYSVIWPSFQNWIRSLAQGG